MSITSSDAVLHESRVEINMGNPMWALLFVIVISGFYIWFMGLHIYELSKNINDMGFEKLKIGLSSMIGSMNVSLSKRNLFSIL